MSLYIYSEGAIRDKSYLASGFEPGIPNLGLRFGECSLLGYGMECDAMLGGDAHEEDGEGSWVRVNELIGLAG